MDSQVVAGYRRLVLTVTRRPDDEDFLPLRDGDIEAVQELVASLGEVESRIPFADIINMRFGLDGKGVRYLKKIGEHFGVSSERIRQKEKRALRLLRHPSRSWRLRRLFRSVLEEQLEDICEKNRQMKCALDEIKKQEISEKMKAKMEDQLGTNLVDNIGIDQLMPSVRLYNCLRNNGINTLGEIIQKTEFDFLRMKNFGRRTVYELKEILDEYGLSLAKQN